MTDTKKVDELEVGDKVILSSSKGISTISYVSRIIGTEMYEINCLEVEESLFYWRDTVVTYLGSSKKEEKIMKVQKVDDSALYPYFDSLANDETTLKHTSVPVYVKQQLKNIHELFEDVLGLTLEEVKSLYFERKMSIQKSKVSDVSELVNKPKTKKAKELQPGDKTKSAFDGKVLKVLSVELVMRYEELAGYNYAHPDTEYELVD